LLLETDDKEIEIKQVYERVSELKKISLQQLNELTTTNFKNTFRKWHIG
jgi:Tat protein secretion system quality control protein TatD with DNase activity